MVDENYHYDQILRFIRGDYTLNPGLSMLPGYHVIVAAVSKVFSVISLYDIRIISFVLNLILIFVFYLLAQKLNKERALLLTMQYAFLPIMFPFYSLVYTDIFSVGLVLLSLWLVAAGNTTSGALFALISLLVKQTNIIWFFFINLFACQKKIPFFVGPASRVSQILASSRSRINLKTFHIFFLARLPFGEARFGIPSLESPAAKFIKKNWLFVAGYLLFGLFVILNKGVATGAKDYMSSSLFHFSNLYLMLFIFFFLFLPHNLQNFGRIIALFRERRTSLKIIIGMICFFAFYLATFVNNHPWNQYPYFLHNRIVMFFTLNLWLKAVFFLPIAYAILSLYTTRLNKNGYYLLYPLTVIYLLPLWLIEVRYYFIPYTLFLLFRKNDALWIEIVTLVLYFTSSLYLFYGTAQGWFFW